MNLYDSPEEHRPRKFQNAHILTCLKYTPAVTLCAVVFLFIWTLWLILTFNGQPFVFIFLTLEVLANWGAILFMRGKLEPPSEAQSSLASAVSLQRVWFCIKCRMDTFHECYHCPLCDVCIVQRDHHCFFLGTCITRSNMKHFIVLCVYAALSCFYTGSVLISDVALPKPSLYFLPVALGHYISGSIPLLVLCEVLVIDVIIAVGFVTACFGCHQVGVVCLGKLPYSSQIERSNGLFNNLMYTFEAPFGLVNLIVPVSVNNYRRVHFNKLI